MIGNHDNCVCVVIGLASSEVILPYLVFPWTEVCGIEYVLSQGANGAVLEEEREERNE